MGDSGRAEAACAHCLGQAWEAGARGLWRAAGEDVIGLWVHLGGEPQPPVAVEPLKCGG